MDDNANCADSERSLLLVIDDDEGFREFLRKLLDRAGFQVLLATNGREGIDLARKCIPDLILCDLEMPVLDGYGVLAALRQEPALAPLPVVFLTGQTEPEQLRRGMNLGADDYLTKPVANSDLLVAIRTRLARAREHSRLAAAPPEPEETQLENSFLVKSGAQTRLVKFKEISQIIAYGEYSRVFWKEQPGGALLRKALRQWEAELPASHFVRVHRGAIINLDFLERIEKLPSGGMQLRLRGTTEPVPVSLRLAPQLNRKLKSLQG